MRIDIRVAEGQLTVHAHANLPRVAAQLQGFSAGPMPQAERISAPAAGLREALPAKFVAVETGHREVTDNWRTVPCAP